MLLALYPQIWSGDAKVAPVIVARRGESTKAVLAQSQTSARLSDSKTE